VKAAFRLPDALKMHDGVGKWILRKWLEKRLPIARSFAAGRCRDRRSGQGTAAVRPHPPAVRIGPLEAAVLRAVAPAAILRLPPVGDVFETLAAN